MKELKTILIYLTISLLYEIVVWHWIIKFLIHDTVLINWMNCIIDLFIFPVSSVLFLNINPKNKTKFQLYLQEWLINFYFSIGTLIGLIFPQIKGMWKVDVLFGVLYLLVEILRFVKNRNYVKKNLDTNSAKGNINY